MPKVLIVYATWTGNSKEIAEVAANSFKEKDCEVQLSDCLQVKAEAFLAVDICVIATYTYGSEGNLPFEMEGFYEELEELDLSGKVFGTLGSGERFYGYFCKAAIDFDELFEAVGAIRGANVVKIELGPNEEDRKHIARFAADLIKTHQGLK